MSTPTVILFLALLALLANAFVVWWVILVLASRSSATAREAVVRVHRNLAGSALTSAWAVALIATIGSLYFSEIVRFEPCRLCWYQRIAMYPLAVILLVAAARRDPGVRWYAAPLAGIGAVISTYHYVLEWFPQLESGACGVGPPCTLVWFREFGFVSLPYLALSAFLLILALLWIAAPGRPGRLRPVPLGGPRV